MSLLIKTGNKPADRKSAAMSFVLIFVLLMTAACGNKPEDSLFEAFGNGAHGLYSIRLRLEDEASGQPVTGLYQRWIIKVNKAGIGAVYPATITVSGGMPDHGHGLPTQPQITRYLGDGQYLMEGLKLSMNGRWILSFYIAAEYGVDTVEVAIDTVEVAIDVSR